MTDPPRLRTSYDAKTLRRWIVEARQRTFDLVADLQDAQLRVPRDERLNPFLWELGHVAWFQERWILREGLGRAPRMAGGDGLYDSSAVPHASRWSLDLPDRVETLRYLESVRDETLAVLDAPEAEDERLRYYAALAVVHEDMHAEAFLYMRQTLGYAAPPALAEDVEVAGPVAEAEEADDVEVPGGTIEIGSPRDAPFVFDNEKWATEVEVAPFRIARHPVTQAEFAAFVDDDGYRRDDLWTEAGWAWRTRTGAEQPLHWRREDGGWARRHYDAWRAIEPDHPMVHACAHEADAWARWAGRRLPTEAEWLAAAAGAPDADGACHADRRLWPWGSDDPDAERANVDQRRVDTVAVGAHPKGDSAWGCRQMAGNVWEWTASELAPLAGFAPDAYRDYSRPFFGSTRVLKGGSWASRARVATLRYRNFHAPHRRDVFAGFRTCAGPA